MMSLFTEIQASVTNKGLRVVFPEGNDERVLRAAVRLEADKVLVPILIGNRETLEAVATKENVSIENIESIDPETYEERQQMITSFVARRNGKVSPEDAETTLKNCNFFGTMLVYLGLADGLVSGAAHSTADTVRPALQIIKTKPGVSKTSGVFIMVREDEKYVFGDCAINISPNANDLAEIAVESAKTAEIFGVDPKIALLSFSTKGSAKSPETEKVIEATQIAKNLAPHLALDGEFQFDAAFVPEVAKKKAPESPLAGQANVFIFPSLEAGNIGYKIAQRLGNFEAIGPILQGLNKPVNDLSRGCSEEDVFKLAMITAAQALYEKSISK
ncbi:MAG: phosphate acetyltransferase [Bacilli bacterium]